MTFFKVQDPTNKNLVKEFVARRARVREADRNEKMGRAFELDELSRFFQPITSQTQELTQKVSDLPGRIAKAMPKQEQQRPQPVLNNEPPPPYEAPFAEEVEVPGEEGKIKPDNLPTEIITITKDGKDIKYNIGEIPIDFDTEEKQVVYIHDLEKKKKLDSPKIHELLTNNKSNLTWGELDKDEKNDFGKLLVQTNKIKNDAQPNKANSNLLKEKGNGIGFILMFGLIGGYIINQIENILKMKLII